ncbi:Protein fluG [Exophiala dermatitidis]
MQMKRDPRSVLDEVVQQALSLHDIEYLQAESTLDTVAGWSTAAALHGEITPILEKICDQLQDAGNGITVCQFHTESSQGMFEIVTGPLPPREAVDALVFATETIKATFLTHGYKATFFPKSGSGHTGQHLHLSVKNPKPHHETQFLAGLLAHLPAVCAFTMPNPDSYGRVEDLAGATGTWVSWATELRDVPIRKIDATYWEIRCADGTANMYLGLAAVLHAGQLGLENSLELTIQDATEAPGTNEVTRLQRNITQRLPRSLLEALTALLEDEAPRKALGEELFAKYWRHKMLDAEIQGKLSEEERRATCNQFCPPRARVMVNAGIQLIHAFLPAMISRNRGTIISLGSRNAGHSVPYMTAYSASKAALTRFHHDLDLELRDRNELRRGEFHAGSDNEVRNSDEEVNTGNSHGNIANPPTRDVHGIATFVVHLGDVPTTIAHVPGAINMAAVREVDGMRDMLNSTKGCATETPELVAWTIVKLITDRKARSVL